MSLIWLLFLGLADDSLPFDDDDSGRKYTFDDDGDEVAPEKTPKPIPTAKYPMQPITAVLRLREAVFGIIFVVYAVWFVVGWRDISRVARKAGSTVQESLKRYYAAVPTKFVSFGMHRMDAFATGRVCHKGVLTSVRLTKRSDPLGFLFDLVRGKKSVLVFEFIVETKQNVSLMLHVGRRQPGFVEKLKLEQYNMSETELKCYTDLGESRHIFSSHIDSFIERHPKMVRLVEISDANRFDLMREEKHVVRIELEFTRNLEDTVFSDEVVDWAVQLADKFCTVYFPGDVVDRVNKQRASAFIDEKELYDKEGIKQKKD